MLEQEQAPQELVWDKQENPMQLNHSHSEGSTLLLAEQKNAILGVQMSYSSYQQVSEKQNNAMFL